MFQTAKCMYSTFLYSLVKCVNKIYMHVTKRNYIYFVILINIYSNMKAYLDITKSFKKNS